MVDEQVRRDMSKLERSSYEMKQELARLIDSHNYKGALRLLDELDRLGEESKRLVGSLRRSDEVSKKREEGFLRDHEIYRAENDEHRGFVLRMLGRLDEAKGVYKNLLTRTQIPNPFAFRSLFNLAGIHAKLGESSEAWGAFRQADKIHKRLPRHHRDPLALPILRWNLLFRVGPSPPKRKPHRRKK